MTIRLLPTANFLDLQRIMDDLEGFGWDVTVDVDILGNVMVDGIPESDIERVTGFVLNRSKWVVDRILDSDGRALA